MAFVAITAGTLYFRGLSSGKIYPVPFTRATDPGFCTIGSGSSTFYYFPENVQLVDGVIADTVNTLDYLRFDVEDRQNIAKIWGGVLLSTLTAPRVNIGPFRVGKKLELYWYSA